MRATHRSRRGIVLLTGVASTVALSLVVLELNAATAHCIDTRIPTTGRGCGPSAQHTASSLVTRQNLLSRIRQSKQAGTATSDDIAAAGEQLLVELAGEHMAGLNGFACGATAHIVLRDDLGPRTRAYVLRHEMEHLLLDGETEFQVNVAASMAHPIGLLATIGTSVLRAWGRRTSARCFFASTWRVFKVYFLP